MVSIALALSRRIRNCAALALLCAAPGTAEGALANVSGTVTDRETGQPIYGAVVKIERLGIESAGQALQGVTTGKNGAFMLMDMETGARLLIVNSIGFHEYQQEIALETGRATSLEIELESNPIELAPTEIIGESSVVNRRRTGTVTELRPREVELIQAVGTQELLELIPGINGYADDGFGNSRLSIGIRGLNPRRSSRILIMEDGVPIQPAVYVYPNAYYNPPSERVDGMEVVKGSSAIRYGPQTMGGVINYITKRPDGTRGQSSKFSVGNNGFYSALVEQRGLGNHRFITDVQALYKRGRGFRDNNAFDQINGTVKSQYRFSGKKVLYIKANGNFENSNATYTGLTEYSFRTNPNFNPKEDDNFKVLRASLDLIYSSRITADLVGNTTAYINVFDRRWWREDDVFVRASSLQSGDLTPVPYFQSGDIVRIGGGASSFGILRTFYVGGLAQDYSLKHSLFGRFAEAEFGARAHWERFVDDKKIGNAPDTREGVYFTGTPGDDDDPVQIVGQSHHYETAALALYAKDRIDWGKLTFDPGVRFEVFKQDRVDRLRGSILADKVSSVLLPGMGVNYSIGRFNAFAGIHRGYTPPSSGTLKVTKFGDLAAAGGLDLKAEKSWNMEVGIRSWHPDLTLEATGFLIRVRDLVAAGRGTAFKNLGRADTWGLEAGLALKTSRYSRLFPDIHLAYAYLRTEVRSGIVKSATRAGNISVDLHGNELPYAPEHTLTLGVSKQTGSGLLVRADLRYVDEVFTDFENIERTFNRGDTGPVPSYSLLNVSAKYKISTDWSVFLTGKNVLDEIYIGSRLHSNPGQPEADLSSGILIGPRRQINVGVKRGI